MKKSDKVVHIFPNEKFTPSFIEFINNNFDSKKNLFITYGNNYQGIMKGFDSDNRENYEFGFFQIIKLEKNLIKCKRIIIHNLNLPNEILLIFVLQPSLLKKTYWDIWGADLYYFKFRTKTFKSNLYECLRSIIIKNLRGVITHIKGDSELVRNWYKFKGKYFSAFYPYAIPKFNDLFFKRKTERGTTFIQLGNSSDPRNNHKEILNKLAIYRDEDIKIICPLSYGDKNYAKVIIDYGKQIFNDKFIPINDFLSVDEYNQIWQSVDIAIFNHDRQQAMGNITSLLYYGKKVYLRNDITSWDFLTSKDLIIFPCNEIQSVNKFFNRISDEEIQHNRAIIEGYFNIEQCYNDWKCILDI